MFYIINIHQYIKDTQSLQQFCSTILEYKVNHLNTLRQDQSYHYRKIYPKTEKIYKNCELHKMGAKNIPNECLWQESWSVWGYVDVESAQSDFITKKAERVSIY